MGCEGLKLHILHRPHMDLIDLDPQPILGIGSDIYLGDKYWRYFLTLEKESEI